MKVLNMIVRFSVQNWMSFRDKATFSMIATKERQHGTRIPYLKKYQTRILPIASIYGGNASGKTNLFKALNFMKQFVIRGTSLEGMIAIEPFRLDSISHHQPSYFSIEILIEDDIYEYSFSSTRKNVLEEKLVLINANREKILFHRINGESHFHSSLHKNKRLNFVFQGTRDNQLFLTNSVHQKIENFRMVYDWFNETLELLAPDSRFESFEEFFQENHPLYRLMNIALSQLDTGIEQISGEVIPFENIIMPERMRLKLLEDLKEGQTVKITLDSLNERYAISRNNNQFIAKKLVTYHQSVDSNDQVKFEIHHESDGSQRLINLLPAFLEISSKTSKKVYVIDELDRSLHTILTHKLITSYLESCTETSASQLLFTTHDILLLDQNLFRRDEMWVVERQKEGSTHLYSFSDFKDVRYDKDIRKSYLQGRLGGIPHIISNQSLFTEN
jgi:AAA15 family ATPase/GTPase